MSMDRDKFLAYCGSQYDKFEDVKAVVIGIVSETQTGGGTDGIFTLQDLACVFSDLHDALEKAVDIIESKQKTNA